jgi:hypothetical protein
MSHNGNNTNAPLPLFGGIQQEIDRIIEKAGSFFCEEEETEEVFLEQVDERVTTTEVSLLKRNAHMYAKYPAVFHGKYSIPKHWVSDEEVAKAVIIEDVPNRKGQKRREKREGRYIGVLQHLYRELAF